LASVHNFFSFILPTDDEEKSQDVAKEGANIAEEEHKDSSEGDNTPIIASLLPKKKKKERRSKGRREDCRGGTSGQRRMRQHVHCSFTSAKEKKEKERNYATMGICTSY
jgi:hypothetical protein